DGRFRLTAPRPAAGRLRSLDLFASAPGHALRLHGLNPDVDTHEVALALGREQVLRGRLVDLQGQPAAGVTVHVSWVAFKAPKAPAGARFDAPPQGLEAWPAPLTTDAEGRFVLRGVGREVMLTLQIRGDGFAPKDLELEANDGEVR